MQPIVQTLEVIADLDLEDGSELLRVLRRHSEQMHSLVPDVVGMSVGTVEHDLTLTFAATSAEIAVLDLSPRILTHRSHVLDDPLLDEVCWQRLAHVTAAKAVSSTLTLPILARGVVVNSVDLYAASWNAFTNLHEDIAVVFGAWAPGAVINADLPFSTRHDAERGPARRLARAPATDQHRRRHHRRCARTTPERRPARIARGSPARGPDWRRSTQNSSSDARPGTAA